MQLYHHQIKVFLCNTDATGVLYFAEQLKMAQMAFECYLQEKKICLSSVLGSGFCLPIIHVESDYFSPLFIGDLLDISVQLIRRGTTSFTLEFAFTKNDTLVGKVLIVHVTVSKETREKIPIPASFIPALDGLALSKN